MEAFHTRSRFITNANQVANAIISQPGLLADTDVLALMSGWRDGTLQLETLGFLNRNPEAAFVLRLVAHRAGFGVESPFHLEEMRAKAGAAQSESTEPVHAGMAPDERGSYRWASSRRSAVCARLRRDFTVPIEQSRMSAMSA